MIEAARLLAGQEGCQVYILAPAFPGPYAMEEQQAWLDRYLPEIPQENRLFVPLGQSKAQALGRPLTQEDVLVDGFSRNLPDWEKAGGVGIQSLNQANDALTPWQGAFVRVEWNGDAVAAQVLLAGQDTLEHLIFSAAAVRAMDTGFLREGLSAAAVPYAFLPLPQGGASLFYPEAYAPIASAVLDAGRKRGTQDAPDTAGIWEEAGQWEAESRVPAKDQLTEWNGDMGMYTPLPGVSDGQLVVRQAAARHTYTPEIPEYQEPGEPSALAPDGMETVNMGLKGKDGSMLPVVEFTSYKGLSGPVTDFFSEELQQYSGWLAEGSSPGGWEERAEKALVVGTKDDALAAVKISGPAPLVDFLERAAKEKLPEALADRALDSETMHPLSKEHLEAWQALGGNFPAQPGKEQSMVTILGDSRSAGIALQAGDGRVVSQVEIDSPEGLSGPIARVLSEEMKQYRDRLDAGGMQPEESVERELLMNLNGEAPTPIKISGPASLVDSLERAAKAKLPEALGGRQKSPESSGCAPIREQLARARQSQAGSSREDSPERAADTGPQR